MPPNKESRNEKFRSWTQVRWNCNCQQIEWEQHWMVNDGTDGIKLLVQTSFLVSEFYFWKSRTLGTSPARACPDRPLSNKHPEYNNRNSLPTAPSSPTTYSVSDIISAFTPAPTPFSHSSLSHTHSIHTPTLRVSPLGHGIDSGIVLSITMD